MVPPSRLPIRTAVVGVLTVLAALVYFGGGGVRGIESALWGYVGLFVCAPSDYAVMDALESDGVNRAARDAFTAEGELETSCDPDDRSISGDLRLASTDPWDVALRKYQELMSSNGWTPEGRIQTCYQKSVEGRLIEAYLLHEQRTEDEGVTMVLSFSARPGGCELLNDPELVQEWLHG